MKCQICNTVNDEESKVCVRCGASLEKLQTEEQYLKKVDKKNGAKLSIIGVILILFLLRMLIKVLIVAVLHKDNVSSVEDRNSSYTQTDTREHDEEIKNDSDSVSEKKNDSVDERIFGTVNGDVYENEVLGYGCRLSRWVFANKVDLLKMNKDLVQMNGNDDEVLIMYAETSDGLQNINIQMRDLGILYGIGMSQNEMQEMLNERCVETCVELKKNLESRGYSDVEVEITDIQIGDDVYEGIKISGNIQGNIVDQKSVLCCCDKYLITITATSFGNESTDQMFSYFYSL